MVDVVLVKGYGDWEALYIDGESVKQNHLGRIEVGKHLEGETVDSYERRSEEVPEGMARFPTDLEEV